MASPIQPKIGDIYWLKNQEGIPHPQVIIQIHGNGKLTVCSLTTNMTKATFPGNILLDPGEGGLEKQSIVEVSKVEEISSASLGNFIGSLSLQRAKEILSAIHFIGKTYFAK